jgi:tyrosine-protein phosphatase YwqE
MSDYFRNGADTILPGRDHLRSLCATHAIPCRLMLAAEYYLDEGFLVKLNNEPLLTLGDNYLLFEISYINLRKIFCVAVFRHESERLQAAAGPSRTLSILVWKFNVYEELKEHDVYFQINTISLAGYYGSRSQKNRRKVIDAGMVNFVWK